MQVLHKLQFEFILLGVNVIRPPRLPTAHSHTNLNFQQNGARHKLSIDCLFIMTKKIFKCTHARARWKYLMKIICDGVEHAIAGTRNHVV